jgi:hypothetical protein
MPGAPGIHLRPGAMRSGGKPPQAKHIAAILETYGFTSNDWDCLPEELQLEFKNSVDYRVTWDKKVEITVFRPSFNEDELAEMQEEAPRVYQSLVMFILVNTDLPIRGGGIRW